MSLYAAGFLLYAVTAAFTFDEGYHLLAAQLIAGGKTPYIDFCFPQAPLNAYLNSLWLRILGQTWRVPHVMAALATIGAVAFIADYVLRHFPAPAWRTRAAIAAALMVGLNVAVFAYGPLQAYGICLFGLSAAFRLTVRAVERERWREAAGAGFLAGVATGSSLLTAAAAPVFLIWTLYYQRPGQRWKTFAAFALGIALPFAPVFYLFTRGPRQAWFNLVRYHAFYRTLYWPETTQHDLEILTSWIDSGHALILGLLALGGLLYVSRRSGWSAPVKAQFYLCAWLAAAVSAEVGRAHPTFSRYFLLTVPFLAILAAAGLYALAKALDLERSPFPVIVLALLLSLGLGKMLYERDRDTDNWATYKRLAAKVDEVTPRGAPVLTVEPIYFLTRRTPPSGYELSYTHLVKLPPAEATLFHIYDENEVKRQVQSLKFATVYSCDNDEMANWGVKALYKHSVELENCTIFWDPRVPRP